MIDSVTYPARPTRRPSAWAWVVLVGVACLIAAGPRAALAQIADGGPLALPMVGTGESPADPAGLLAADTKPDSVSVHDDATLALSAERVQILLRSLTVPGWGQATQGRTTAATVFGLTELGVWTSFTAFRVQEQLRRGSYESSAQILAGINLNGRDEEFRRIVGSYISSEEYNLLVVSRDAANLYYDDPAAYRQYIADHSLKGVDTWAWPDDGALLKYRGQRQDAQRARNRANTCLALAIVNRLASVLDAARVKGGGKRSDADGSKKQTWDLETIPFNGDLTAFRLGIRTRF